MNGDNVFPVGKFRLVSKSVGWRNRRGAAGEVKRTDQGAVCVDGEDVEVEGEIMFGLGGGS